LLAGSPAIDAGDPAAVAGGGVPSTDQRGAPYTRVFNGDGIGGARIDIGAFELQSIALASSGDFNQNGRVDAADYVLWRNTKGTTGVPAFTGADGDGDGIIGQGDYNVWRSHFGNTTGAGSGASAEPAVTSVSSSESATFASPASLTQVVIPTSNASTTLGRVSLMASMQDKLEGNFQTIDWHSFNLSDELVSGHVDNALLGWLDSRARSLSPRSDFSTGNSISGDEARDKSPSDLADCGLEALFATVEDGV
jgi:hypothetical protein